MPLFSVLQQDRNRIGEKFQSPPIPPFYLFLRDLLPFWINLILFFLSSLDEKWGIWETAFKNHSMIRMNPGFNNTWPDLKIMIIKNFQLCMHFDAK